MRYAALYVFTVEKPSSDRKSELIVLEQEGESWKWGEETVTLKRKVGSAGSDSSEV